MPRTFLAITLPRSIRGTFSECRQLLCAADPGWRSEKWVAEENLHVTLRFLGQVPESAYPELVSSVGHWLSGATSYRLRLDAVRAVPRSRSASLLWVGASAGALETGEIAARIEQAVAFLPFEPDGRGFKTHVTLCRARRPRRVERVALDEVEHFLSRADERAITMSVREVTLMESTLTPHGPVYEERAVIPLGAI